MLQNATAEEYLRLSEFFRTEAMTQINGIELYTNHPCCTSFIARDFHDWEIGTGHSASILKTHCNSFTWVASL
jgi:hypothetical protein